MPHVSLCFTHRCLVAAVIAMPVSGAAAQYMSPAPKRPLPKPTIASRPENRLPKDPEIYCKSPECQRSFAPHEAMLAQDFQVMFEQDPVCETIVHVINNRRHDKSEPGVATIVIPKTRYADVDLKHIYASSIFLRWNSVPYWYDSPDLFYPSRGPAMGLRADAWLIVPYLNDNVPRLVASVGFETGLKDLTYNVDPRSYGREHWDDPEAYASLAQLHLPPMSPCNVSGDPLEQLFAWGTTAHYEGGKSCKDTWVPIVHAPANKKFLYGIVKDFRPHDLIQNAANPLKWPIFYRSGPIQFANIGGAIYVFYTFSDFEESPFDSASLVKHLTTGVILSVVKFSDRSYADLCLLAVGTGVTAISAQSDIGNR